jgi:uncharacterized protein (TIGR02996 family)
MIEQLLQALHHAPGDDVAWLALADALEESDDPRAEMTRLTTYLRRHLRGQERKRQEARLQELLAGGMRPCVPTLKVSHGIELTLIPPGVFLMGAKRREEQSEARERPRHEVEITRAFYLSTKLITQAQYRAVTRTNPSTFRPNPRSHYDVPYKSTDDFPVDSVTDTDALAFCEALSARPAEKKAGRVYRLPTEAEWEYACRAGTQTVFAFGDTLHSSQANFDGNYAYPDIDEAEPTYYHRTCPVGQYGPNGFRLYDVHGQLWEWCSDRFQAKYYATSPRQDPPGPSRGRRDRVLRGGSWIDAGWNCRSATRSDREAVHYVGLRLATSVVQ